MASSESDAPNLASLSLDSGAVASSSSTTLDDTTPTPSSPKMRVADKWVKPNGPPVGVTFGARHLKDEEDVFNHNAWDHVVLPDDFREKAEVIMQLHQANPVAASKREAYNTDPASYWNKFYADHKEEFFKDRGWLRLEYPELIACSEADAGPKTVLEVGCGAGNTVFPLLMHNENPDLKVYATDYSKTAVNVVKANPMYPTPSHGKGVLHASVWDITSSPSSSNSTPFATSSSNESSSSTDATGQNSATGATNKGKRKVDYSLPEGLGPGSVDVITVIFVLSALHPKEWEQAIHNLWVLLKPNGLLCIRDYGRHDLAQLRIKRDRLLDPEIGNLYIRGDGTRVYFFEKEELGGMLTRSPRTSGVDDLDDGAENEKNGVSETVGGGQKEGKEGGNGTKGMFVIDQLGEDRRLLVNRTEKLKMYRIWLQVKARKVI